jgi:hypothetical protein
MKMSGWEPRSIDDWKTAKGIDESSQIRLVRLSHMRYQHPDFASISVFLQDFGMHLVKQTEEKMWWGGYGDQHYVYVVEKGETKKYLGGAFEVESYADLERYLTSTRCCLSLCSANFLIEVQKCQAQLQLKS